MVKVCLYEKTQDFLPVVVEALEKLTRSLESKQQSGAPLTGHVAILSNIYTLLEASIRGISRAALKVGRHKDGEILKIMKRGLFEIKGVKKVVLVKKIILLYNTLISGGVATVSDHVTVADL